MHDTEDPATLTPRVAGFLAPLRLGRSAIIEAVRIAMIRPVTTIPDTAKRASAETREVEFYYRAAYIVQAATRMHTIIRSGKPVSEAVRGERAAYQRHLDAQGKRATSAMKINRLSARGDGKLGWYATLDARTSPECRAANGKNFYADQRPSIGFPGSVHPSCRCEPGPAHAGAALVYPIKSDRQRKTA